MIARIARVPVARYFIPLAAVNPKRAFEITTNSTLMSVEKGEPYDEGVAGTLIDY